MGWPSQDEFAIGQIVSAAWLSVSGAYLGFCAGEMAWREDHRRKSNGVQYLMATNAALTHPVSRQWKGYWQRYSQAHH